MAIDNSIEYGRRLIPQILDSLASTEPNRVLYSIASFGDNSHNFHDITALNLARAVDKTAWWLKSHVGESTSIRTVGYIGPHDLRHVLLTYAAVKAGCSAVFLSPKNSTEGALAVLEASKCNLWVKAIELPLIDDFLQQRTMKVLELPSLDELLDAVSINTFPYTKTFDEAIQDPFCILHTSGTTGSPKPISWSHGLIGTMDAVRRLPPTDGDNGLAPWPFLWNEGETLYSSFPMSHGAGVIMDILLPALFGLHCMLGPKGVLPNLNLVEKLADHAKIDIWSMVPSLVDELGETPDVLAKLKSSKFICASGGPVSPTAASKVNDVIRVLNLTGTTEGLFIGNLVVDREDWLWFAFHPFSGFEFKEVEPGVYEQWIHRNEHWALFQGIFHTFPLEKSINLKDLYIKHPTKPDLFAFKGRSDDAVVLSNGYKISPLNTEALITTHPAIHGCLMIGMGKPQAGLLIELQDPTSKPDELLDNIWTIVERANTLSTHQNQLQKDYITFAEPGKPFIRTDKATVKRRATLTLYADYIERFYSSRSEDIDVPTIDTSSIETLTEAIRQILGDMVPEIHTSEPDVDFFTLGLDSLMVFRATNIFRSGMKLQGILGPRHLYGNPTLAKFSSLLLQLVKETRSSRKHSPNSSINDKSVKIKMLIDQHKARQPIKMNPFDHVNFNHYMGLEFFFSLKEGITFEQAFESLQAGLRRTFQLIPELEGKIIPCSEHEIGYKKGDLQVTLPPLSMSSTTSTRELRHLTYKDLSQVLPSFEKLCNDGFKPSAYSDELTLSGDPFPKLPADILIAQANFIQGGCILAANFHHSCFDGVSVMIALKTWAECCRYIQGDLTAKSSWLDPESFNRSLPSILYEQEGFAKPAHEVDPGVWGYLPFVPPEGHVENYGNSRVSNQQIQSSDSKRLPPAPVFARRFALPPTPPADGRYLRTTMFLIPSEKVQQLKDDVLADPASKGLTSVSDIIQAFFWRAAIKARYRVGTQIRGETFTADDISILELPIDGRPYFSSHLPESYMGSMLFLNRPNMPVEKLCSPDTSIGDIAYVLRESAARITPSLVHDVFTLLQSLPDYNRFTIANMGIGGHLNAMISNMMLFQPGEISFGDGFFGDGGKPKALRPQIERGRKHFRFLVIYPMRSDGGVELVLGTLPEELEMLEKDEEFMKYAELVDCEVFD